MWAYSAAQSAAVAAWATLVVLTATAGVAAWQVRQNRSLRREQARPFVVVHYDFRSVLIQITIENIGRTVARNVCVAFDQPLTSVQWKDRDFGALSLLRNPIPNLAPGQAIRINLDQFPNRVKAGLPMAYVATVDYEDFQGRRLPSETYELDLAPFVDTARAPNGLHDLVNEVEGIRNEIRKWTDAGDGLRVKGLDQDRANGREVRSYLLTRFVVTRREDGLRAAFRELVCRLRRQFGWTIDV